MIIMAQETQEITVSLETFLFSTGKAPGCNAEGYIGAS